jgi:hypothetical protein
MYSTILNINIKSKYKENKNILKKLYKKFSDFNSMKVLSVIKLIGFQLMSILSPKGGKVSYGRLSR